MMKILILGSQGMQGHITKQYFKEQGYDVIGTTRDREDKYYFDAVENMNRIEKIIKEEKPKVVINCIGILNKVAEEQKWMAALINSYLPHYLDKLSIDNNFKLIHMSTDCVFDGKKGSYVEDDFRDAVSFYGQSKALGEINNDRNITIRTSIVGPDINENGIGLFQWFTKQKGEIGGYTKVIWTGVTTLQLAKCMEKAIQNNLSGLHHAVNNEEIDKYSLLMLFRKYFNKNVTINKEEDYVSNKSLVRTGKSFDFGIPSYETMVEEMNEWILKHPELYKIS